MTQSTQEKLESIKAALNLMADGSEEIWEMYPDDCEEKAVMDFAKETLKTVLELEADIASEEMVEKVALAIGSQLNGKFEYFDKPFSVTEQLRGAAKVSIAVILGK